MTMSDVAAQLASMLVSALGIVVFRLIARYLPEDPVPVPRRRHLHTADEDSTPDPDLPPIDTGEGKT